jgi:hypothetical protein
MQNVLRSSACRREESEGATMKGNNMDAPFFINNLEEKNMTNHNGHTTEDKEAISFIHDRGQVALTYDDAVKYHDKDHWGGVALAFKVIRYASLLLNDGLAMDRQRITVRTGLNPPGLMDTFEFLTRAVTRRRIIVDPMLSDGPRSAFGNFSFEIGYGRRWVRLRLKEGILPADFASLGKKCEADLGTDEETKRWVGLKHDLGDQIIIQNPADILEVTGRGE